MLRSALAPVLVWVFGYGSLIWRPSIPFEAWTTATLSGFARRFWQGSTDHRGVPGRPGRVVTLVSSLQDRCPGVAYRVRAKDEPGVLARLDHREKGGYDRLELALRLADGSFIQALAYRANEDNPNWLGPASIADIADQVVASFGPSGPNTEYVLELDAALDRLGLVDAHVHSIAQAVRSRMRAP